MWLTATLLLMICIDRDVPVKTSADTHVTVCLTTCKIQQLNPLPALCSCLHLSLGQLVSAATHGMSCRKLLTRSRWVQEACESAIWAFSHTPAFVDRCFGVPVSGYQSSLPKLKTHLGHASHRAGAPRAVLVSVWAALHGQQERNTAAAELSYPSSPTCMQWRLSQALHVWDMYALPDRCLPKLLPSTFASLSDASPPSTTAGQGVAGPHLQYGGKISETRGEGLHWHLALGCQL